MTTIAWDGETLAADSCVSSEEFTHPTFFTKLRKVSNLIIGSCGDVYSSLQFERWVRNNHAKEGLLCENAEANFPRCFDENFEAIVVFPWRAVTYNRLGIPHTVSDREALGSGAGYAIAAMLAGADAKRAVEIACQLDPSSGGKVKVIS